MRVGRGVAVLAAVVLCLALPVAPAAHAGTGTDLPFNALFKMVVDGDHGLEFVSGGPGTSDLVVLDVDGTVVTTITLQGPSGMALIGSSLYVAEGDGPSIAVVDTTADPPVLDHTLDVGSFSQLTDLTYVQGRLWFYTASGIATMLPDGSDLRGPFVVGAYYEPRFAEGLTGGRDLITFDEGICGASVYEYTATVPPRSRDSESAPGGACNGADMAVVPGMASLLIAAGSPYAYPEVRLADLAVLRSYVAAPYPTAVAVTSAHGGLVVGGSNGIYNPDVWVYRLGYTPSLYTYDFGTTDVTVFRRGVAWSADGDRIFVVTTGTTAQFHVLLPTGLPTVAPTTLTVTPSAGAVPLAGTVDVTVHLGGGTTNRDVKLYSQPSQGTRTLIGSGTVDAGGDLTVAGYAPPASTTLTAVYSGDADWGAASKAAWVDVTSTTTIRLRKSIGTDGTYRLYRVNDPAILDAQVQPPAQGGHATVVVQVDRGHGWKGLSSSGGTYGTGGTLTSFWLPAGIRGDLYRVKVRSAWTGTYLPSTSTWAYYRFVKGGT